MSIWYFNAELGLVNIQNIIMMTIGLCLLMMI